mmetsp:Transcript_7619/g.20826  ORF Transcript_7619/g.20826 Transcript_7619/m.20826 type:complete len:201 (+) Transcript_7619:688-1290(+)
MPTARGTQALLPAPPSWLVPWGRARAPSHPFLPRAPPRRRPRNLLLESEPPPPWWAHPQMLPPAWALQDPLPSALPWGRRRLELRAPQASSATEPWPRAPHVVPLPPGALVRVPPRAPPLPQSPRGVIPRQAPSRTCSALLGCPLCLAQALQQWCHPSARLRTCTTMLGCPLRLAQTLQQGCHPSARLHKPSCPRSLPPA